MLIGRAFNEKEKGLKIWCTFTKCNLEQLIRIARTFIPDVFKDSPVVIMNQIYYFYKVIEADVYISVDEKKLFENMIYKNVKPGGDTSGFTECPPTFFNDDLAYNEIFSACGDIQHLREHEFKDYYITEEGLINAKQKV